MEIVLTPVYVYKEQNKTKKQKKTWTPTKTNVVNHEPNNVFTRKSQHGAKYM